MSRWSTGWADAWQYGYTDFGEGYGRSPHPVLRAVVGVAAPGAASRFAAIIDTGGPITVVAAEVLGSGGDPVDRITDTHSAGVRATRVAPQAVA